MFRLARLGVGEAMVESRVGVGGDFMVNYFWVGGLGVFRVHISNVGRVFGILLRRRNMGEDIDVRIV